MPWKKQSIVSQRDDLIRLAIQEGANTSGLCRRFGYQPQDGPQVAEAL